MRWCAAALTFLILTGCAYIGEPLPPALKIPERVTDLRAVQRGDKIYIDFTPPKLTTEGLVIDKLGEPELQIEQTPVTKETSARPWAGQTVQVRVRFANRRGRVSNWSNVVLLSVIEPLARPAAPRAESRPNGVAILPADSAHSFRVYRDGELLGESKEAPFIDTTAERDKTYQYAIQTVHDSAESEISESVTATYKDTFPPATPSRFTTIAGISSVELSWERSIEPDFAFYRVYRDGKVIADKLSGPNASDTQVQSGTRYRYAVTAVDQTGNESPQSAAVEIVFP